MSAPAPLPGTIRRTLERALEVLGRLRDPASAGEEELAELKALVRQAYAELQALGPAAPRPALTSVRVADGILQYLEDLDQKDARGRLRDVQSSLREAV